VHIENVPTSERSALVASLPEKGDLLDFPPLKLLALFSLHRKTGLLHISLEDRDLSVFFRHGSLAQVFSTHAEDAHRADPASAKALLRRLLAQTQGAFLLEEVDLPSRQDLPLGDGLALVPALVRETPTSIRQPSLPQDACPKLQASPFLKLGQLGLEPMEIHLAIRFNGKKTLSQLRTERPAEAELLSRVALLLFVFGLLRFETAAPLPKPPPPVAQETTAFDLSKLLKAEELFRKSQGLLRVRNHRGALDKLNEAMALVPHEPEFYAWRGYLDFLASQNLDKSEQDFQAALSLQPRCVSVFYFRGIIARMLGKKSHARECFAKCLEWEPRHQEAIHELEKLT
jgi:tetratricopeptide (TPR) repeat protein